MDKSEIDLFDGLVSAKGAKYKKAAETKKVSFSAAEFMSFNEGDRVEHRTFGQGTIVKSTPVGNDCILEIDFDNAGFKRLMAAFAKVKKVN